MCISQKEFDEFVQSFNEDYLELLKIAAIGERFELLVESFVRLKDLYEVITVMYETDDLEYKTGTHPFNINDKNGFLESFGFTKREIKRIKKFLKKFRANMDCDFQEFMLSKTDCRRKKSEVKKALIRSSSIGNFTTNPATA